MTLKVSLQIFGLTAVLLALNACGGSIGITRNKKVQLDYTPQDRDTRSQQINLRLISK